MVQIRKGGCARPGVNQSQVLSHWVCSEPPIRTDIGGGGSPGLAGLIQAFLLGAAAGAGGSSRAQRHRVHAGGAGRHVPDGHRQRQAGRGQLQGAAL